MRRCDNPRSHQEYLASVDAAAYLRTQSAQLKAALSDLGLAK